MGMMVIQLHAGPRAVDGGHLGAGAPDDVSSRSTGVTQDRVDSLIRRTRRIEARAPHASDPFLLADAEDAAAVRECRARVPRSAAETERESLRSSHYRPSPAWEA